MNILSYNKLMLISIKELKKMIENYKKDDLLQIRKKDQLEFIINNLKVLKEDIKEDLNKDQFIKDS